MKALKALVIFMGMLLVVGLGVLGWGMSTTAGRPHPPRAVAPAPAGEPAATFGDVEVGLPAGARVTQMEVAGERLVVRIVAGGRERVVVLDPVAGRVVGTFVLVPAQ